MFITIHGKPGQVYVHELMICEAAFIIPRPNEYYVFRIDPECEKCRALDVYHNVSAD